jgi:hypothetical protein
MWIVHRQGAGAWAVTDALAVAFARPIADKYQDVVLRSMEFKDGEVLQLIASLTAEAAACSPCSTAADMAASTAADSYVNSTAGGSSMLGRILQILGSSATGSVSASSCLQAADMGKGSYSRIALCL